MIRNNSVALGGVKVPLDCLACGSHTTRSYDEERHGFGRCKCGGELQRRGTKLAAKRRAKAKRELAGGPAR